MLAYAQVRGSPPSGDAYTLPGLEQYRDGVKRVFNALLFDESHERVSQRGQQVLFPEGKNRRRNRSHPRKTSNARVCAF